MTRAAMTARKSGSVTVRKSLGAKRSVGFRMSAVPQRMNCLPKTAVSLSFVIVALKSRADNDGRRRVRSCQSRSAERFVSSCVSKRASNDPANRSQGSALYDASYRNRLSSMAWLLSLGAVSGYSSKSLSMNPRWVKFCAAADRHNSTGKRARASLFTPQRLQREIFFLHRHIVFELFE